MPNEEPTMSCDESRPLLREATRGALDERTRARIYAHLATCPACRELADEERALDRLLEERLPQHPASLALKRRLQARLPPAVVPVRRPPGRWLVPLAGGLAACAALVIGLRREHPLTDPLVAETIADHLRVVYRDRPIDIESGGPHQVKPWFTGRLDFALPAVFGGDDEFTLQGDRSATTSIEKPPFSSTSGGCTRRRSSSFAPTDSPFRQPTRISAVLRRPCARSAASGWRFGARASWGTPWRQT
jgi:anti-sigma factor RsiW